MPITIGNDPNPALMGQAAYSAGLGQYQQAMVERDFRERQLAQQKDLAQMQIDANKASQLRGIGADYVSQGRSLDATRDNLLTQLQAGELEQKRGLAANRSNIEYQTVESQEEKQRDRVFEENKIRYQNDWEEKKIKYETDNANYRANQQNYYSRLNTMTQAQVQLTNAANNIRAQERSDMFRAYQSQVEGYQKYQYQSYLNEQEGLIRSGLQQQGSQLGFEAWKQQADYTQQQQREAGEYQYSQQQQRQMEQIGQYRLNLQNSLDNKDINKAMYDEGMAALAAREAGITQFKSSLKSPYPPDQQPGMTFSLPMTGPDGKPTGRFISDGNGEPIPFTRNANGEVRIVPGYRVPQAPQAPTPPSFSEQRQLMNDIRNARADYAKMTKTVTVQRVDGSGKIQQFEQEVPRYTDLEIDRMISMDYPGMNTGGTMRDESSRFLPGVGSANTPLPRQSLGGSSIPATGSGSASAIRVNSVQEAKRLPRGTVVQSPDGSMWQVP